MKRLILVIEDEVDLARTVQYNLTQEGYETRVAHNGRDGLTMAQTRPLPDLILLDLMLPDLSGTEVCRQLKMAEATLNIPIIMVTARGDEIDRIVGLEVGADDYVVKPFSVREVMLRIKAILKRSNPSDTHTEERFKLGLIEIDTAGHRAWVDGKRVELTVLEFKLLCTFIERRGRAQSRVQLLDDVWGVQADITTRTVDVHIKRLRTKLGPAGDYIETVRGVGYRLSTTDHPSP